MDFRRVAHLGFTVALAISADRFLAGSLLAQGLPCIDRDGDGYLAGPGCAVQDDCNDDNRLIHPGAVEICNGWDDDCDGSIDEGCDRTCNDFQLTRRVSFKPGGYDARLANADRSWTMVFRDNAFTNGELTFTRLDRRGTRLTTDQVLDDRRNDGKLVWTGARALNAWDYIGGTVVNFGVHWQDLGKWGHAPGGVVRPNSDSTRLNGMEWNGYETTTLWYDDSLEYTCLTRVGAGGEVWEPKLVLTTMKHWDGSFSWDGDGYGWAYTRDSSPGTADLYFRRLNRDGVPVGSELRLTDHSSAPNTFAYFPVIVSRRPLGGYGVCWGDSRTGKRALRCAVLDAAGAMLVPPGETVVSNSTKDISDLFDLEWNGEEFLAVWTNLDSTITGLGKLQAARISASGQILESKLVTSGPQDDDPTVAWSGSSWGVSFEEWPTYPIGAPAAVFAEIGCDCATDHDGDTILPCAGGDCDDNDPAVGAGKAEICNDGKDNDCDGLADCNDPDCAQGGNPPGEISGLSIGADKVTLQWTPNGSASGYDVARGLLSDLRGMQNFKWTDCFRSRMTGTSVPDGQTPDPGDGFYYLVRGRSSTCRIGTWGHTGRDGVLIGCP